MKQLNRALMRDDPQTRARLILAVVALSLCLTPAFAHAQVIVDDLRNGVNLVLTAIKVCAVLFIIAAIAALATGRHWAGAVLGLVGAVGMAKADQIASYFGIGS